jgi:hypothetical protein
MSKLLRAWSLVGVIFVVPAAPVFGEEPSEILIFREDFENGNAQGWVSYSREPAATGLWVIGDPVGHLHNGVPAQPEDAYAGTGCAYTGDNTTPSVGDVDGSVFLEAPPLNLGGYRSATVRYHYWYYQAAFHENRFFGVHARPPGAPGFTFMVRIKETHNEWTPGEVRLEDWVPLVDGLRVRFAVIDGGGGSVVEAAVDEVEIVAICGEDAHCAPDGYCGLEGCVPYGNGDFDEDGDVDLADYACFQTCYGAPADTACAAANFTGSAEVDADDYAAFAAALETLAD